MGRSFIDLGPNDKGVYLLLNLRLVCRVEFRMRDGKHTGADLWEMGGLDPVKLTPAQAHILDLELADFTRPAGDAVDEGDSDDHIGIDLGATVPGEHEHR